MQHAACSRHAVAYTVIAYFAGLAQCPCRQIGNADRFISNSMQRISLHVFTFVVACLVVVIVVVPFAAAAFGNYLHNPQF